MSSIEGCGSTLLAAAVDRLAVEDATGLADVGLADQLVALSRLADRLAAEVARRVAVLDARRGFEVDGAVSTVTWLRQRCRLDPSTARRLVMTARTLRNLPATSAAFAAGDVGPGHAAAIADALHRLGAAVVDRAEPALLTAARAADPGAVRRLVEHLRDALTPEQVAADEQTGHDRVYLHLSRTLGGMVALDGWLNPEQCATLAAALAPLMRPVRPDDPRGAPRRRAEALVELARRALDRGDLPEQAGERPHLIVTASIDRLLGQPDAAPVLLDHAGTLSTTAARRLACDAQVTRVLLGSDNLPLDVGRTHRLVTPAQRPALRVRDGGCVFIRCGRPVSWCDAHHVRSWLDGGATNLNNLVLLCRRHHRFVHERGWTISGSPGGWQFDPPRRAGQHESPIGDGPRERTPALAGAIRLDSG